MFYLWQLIGAYRTVFTGLVSGSNRSKNKKVVGFWPKVVVRPPPQYVVHTTQKFHFFTLPLMSITLVQLFFYFRNTYTTIHAFYLKVRTPNHTPPFIIELNIHRCIKINNFCFVFYATTLVWMTVKRVILMAKARSMRKMMPVMMARLPRAMAAAWLSKKSTGCPNYCVYFPNWLSLFQPCRLFICKICRG